MENFEILKEAERKARFRAILREFGQVMLFLGAVVAATGWWASQYRSQQFHWQSDAETQISYRGRPHFGGGGLAFSGVKLLSEEVAHSGRTSIKLDAANPYGFQAEVEKLRGNEQLKVTVWRYSPQAEGQSAGLIAEVRGLIWEFKGDVVATSPQGWQQIALTLTLDCRTRGKTLRIYCWNPTQAVVYFDDISVEMFRPGWW